MAIQAAIIAGGQGSRMRKFSDTPKVMLPLGGKPLLEHQLEWLKAAGFAEVLLCLGYRAEVVKDYFGDGGKWGLSLQYQVEGVPRGTAGAVKDLGARVRGDLLVLYGDLYVGLKPQPLFDFHNAHPGAGTLVVRRTDHPEDSDLVEMEGERVTKIGRGIGGDLGCAAVWIVRPPLMQYVPETGASDFARDVFPAAVDAGLRLAGYVTEETVADVGTPDRFEAFSKRFAES